MISRLAERDACQDLYLVTRPACGVGAYYQKLGFERISGREGVIVMSSPLIT